MGIPSFLEFDYRDASLIVLYFVVLKIFNPKIKKWLSVTDGRTYPSYRKASPLQEFFRGSIDPPPSPFILFKF